MLVGGYSFIKGETPPKISKFNYFFSKGLLDTLYFT